MVKNSIMEKQINKALLFSIFMLVTIIIFSEVLEILSIKSLSFLPPIYASINGITAVLTKFRFLNQTKKYCFTSKVDEICYSVC